MDELVTAEQLRRECIEAGVWGAGNHVGSFDDFPRVVKWRFSDLIQMALELERE